MPSQDDIQVLIIPGDHNDKPTPGILLMKTVEQFLLERRLVTTKVKVVGPEYVDIMMALQVVLVTGTISQEGQIKNEIERRLRSNFHPILGGSAGEGWPMGRDVYLSDMISLIEQVVGVDYLTQLEMHESGSHVNAERIFVPSNGFPYLERIQIDIILE
mgnify:CR=1 FL=1